MAEALIQYASAGQAQAQARSGPSGAVWWALRITWGILATATLWGIGGYVATQYSALMGILSPLWTVLTLVAVAVLMRGLRQSWDATTLEYLEQAVRLNLPLPGMLRAAEATEGRFVRKRIGNLRGHIEAGSSVGRSLARALPGLAVRVQGLIESGERCGRLAPTLRRIVEQDRRRVQRDPIQRIYLRWYPIMLLLALGAVVTVIGVYVMPKFDAITRSFNIHTRWVASWGAVSRAAIFAFPVVGLLAILICAQLLVALFHPRYGGTGPLRRWTDWLIWQLPVVRSATRGRALGDTCDMLAGSVESGMNLHGALIETAEACTNAVLRNRLHKWAAGIEAGLGVDHAARAARMPPIVSGLLATADATPDLSNVFRFLGRYYDGQFSRTALLLEGAVIPGISIVFGGAVLLVSLSVFVPLVKMMEHLTPVGVSR